MKRTTALLAFILMAIAIQAQKNMFADRYAKLRKPTEEDVLIMKYNKDDIQHLITNFDFSTATEEKRREFLEGKPLFEKASLVVMVMDTGSDGFLSSSQIDELLKPYEVLADVEADEMHFSIWGIMKKDKIQEIIFIADIEDEMLFFVDVMLGKPELFHELIKDPLEIGKLFKFETSRKVGESNYKITDERGMVLSPPEAVDSESFELQVVKINNLYGVKRTTSDEDDYVIKPTFVNEIVLYGSNPGNTYAKVTENKTGYCILYDKYGFTVAHGNEITPILTSDESDVACFILRQENRYALYECPEKYTLIQIGNFGDKDFGLVPHIDCRIRDCSSIELTDQNVLKCTTADRDIELITVAKLNK